MGITSTGGERDPPAGANQKILLVTIWRAFSSAAMPCATLMQRRLDLAVGLGSIALVIVRRSELCLALHVGMCANAHRRCNGLAKYDVDAADQGRSIFMAGANMVFSKIITFGVTVAFAGMLVIAAVGSSGLLLDY